MSLGADTLSQLTPSRGDDVVVAVSDRLSTDEVDRLTRVVSAWLQENSVTGDRRCWLVATSGSDEAAARTAAAISDAAPGARVLVHDRRDLDGLIFERRNPGERRGGVYLNAVWQSAGLRIGCGDALELVDGLSAWFNEVGQLSADDLDCDALLGLEPAS